MSDLIVKMSDLKAGDILLYHGTKSWISKAICKLDGTEYNHAALYYENNKVLEVVAKGVVENNIDTSIYDSDHVTVLRLKPEQADMQPVVAVTKNYLDTRYADEQLLLLVVICLFRKIKMNKIMAKIIEFILQKAAVLLLNIFGIDGKTALICSELVYRSYNEADKTNGIYKIQIDRSQPKIQSIVEEGSLYTRLFGNSAQITLNLNKKNFVPTGFIILEEECETLVEELSDNYTEERIDDITEQKLKSATENLFAAALQTHGKTGLTNSINILDV